MKKLFPILLLALFTGCLTTQKAEDFLMKKGALAGLCATEYPVADSLGAPVVDSIKPAHNPDYTPAIDNLDAAVNHLVTDLQQHADSACEEVQQRYRKELLQLQRQIRILKEQYRPCKPDTLLTTQYIYRRDRAYEAVLESQLKSYRDSLIRAHQTIAVKEAKIQDLTASRNWWRKWGGYLTWSVLAGLILLAVFRSRLPFKL